MLQPAGRPRRADLALPLLLLAATFVLFHRALDLFWHADDFYNLRFARHHTALQILVSPETWAELPFKMVTPLMFHSFQVDLALAGASTRAFYLHQILAIALGAVSLYVVLRLWLPPLAGLAGAGLSLLGAPTGALAADLMVRHYPEGIALVLLSLAAFVVALRRSERPAATGRFGWIGWSLFSAALYAAACLAKEIAVPLLFGLLLLPERDLRTRLRCAVPHAGVLALYFAYRFHLLSTLVGGYGWAVERGDWARLALALPGKMAREMVGGGGAWGWVLLALCLLAAAFAARSPGAAARWLAAFALTLLPVLPVSTEMKPRLAAAPWALLAAAAACGGAQLSGWWREPGLRRSAARPLRLGRLACIGLGLGLGLLAWRGSWSATWAAAERTSSENRAFLRLGRGDLLLHPLGYPSAMAELRIFRAEARGGSPSAAWAYDEIDLCPAPGRFRVWEYDERADRVVDRSAEVPAICASWRRRLRAEAPLSATFRSSPPLLTWSLGPYGQGRYALVFDEGAGLLVVAPQGGYQSPPARFDFRVRYESPDGWITYSPLLVADFQRRPVLAWSRGGGR